ncbi:MAG: gamma-glutamylcyclotransferase [Candidatus Binatia bacterium]
MAARTAVNQKRIPIISTEGVWIFGYGSLMWDPGFTCLEAQPALLRGYHRAFCIYSIRFRGTPERPGLVLGLDRGGSCRGRVFRVAAAKADEVFAYLYDREMIHEVYTPKYLPVHLSDRTVWAHTYVANRNHQRYTGKLSLEQSARLILDGWGKRGSNVDYLKNTVYHLDDLGISDGPVHRLLEVVQQMCGSGVLSR